MCRLSLIVASVCPVGPDIGSLLAAFELRRIPRGDRSIKQETR